MILIDFRNWTFDKSLGFLPNAQKQLLQRDFDTITKIKNFEVLDLGDIKPLSIADLFFKNEEQIAVSAIKNIENYYEIIDNVLELENKETIDYTEAAEEDVYFYGKNALVSDTISEIALCGINEFADESLFEEYCEDFELTPFSFDLSDDLQTSDVAVFTGKTLLICLDYIADKKVKKQLFGLLKSSGIKTITFTKEQVAHGVLDLLSIDDKLYATKKAYDLFTAEQKKAMSNIEIIDLPFLDKAGVKLRDIIL